MLVFCLPPPLFCKSWSKTPPMMPNLFVSFSFSFCPLLCFFCFAPFPLERCFISGCVWLRIYFIRLILPFLFFVVFDLYSFFFSSSHIIAGADAASCFFCIVVRHPSNFPLLTQITVLLQIRNIFLLSFLIFTPFPPL